MVEEWIQRTLAEAGSGLAVVPAAFLFGILGSVGSCCTLPVLGAVAGYAGGTGGRQGRRELLLLGSFFAIGTIVSLCVLGAVAGFAGQMAGTVLGRYWRFAAGLLTVLFGIFAVGLLKLRVPWFNSTLWKERRGSGGAFLYGLALGGGTTACAFGCNPLLPMAIGAAVLSGATMTGAAILASFAIGYALPLTVGIVGLGLGIGHLSRVAAKVTPVARIVGGIVLLVVGFYLLSGV